MTRTDAPRRSWPAAEDVHTLIFDFDGVFTDNKVLITEDGTEIVRCDRGDGLGFDMLRSYCRARSLDLNVLILSKETNRVVTARARKLQVECRQCVADKLSVVTKYLEARWAGRPEPFSGVLYVGNDLNDLALGLRAGFFVVPADGHPIVRAAATAVLDVKGGEGAVRKVIEELLRVDQMGTSEIDRLTSGIGG